MKITLDWLTEFVDPAGLLDGGDWVSGVSDSRVRRLTEALNSLGMVVEAVEFVPASLSGVVIAEVLQVDPIEGADRIRLATVNDGTGKPREVVCGAWNYGVGDKVPLALPGTTLPNGVRIERRKLKGQVSEGMLCSASEVGVSQDAKGLLILDRDAKVGEGFGDYYGIRDDVVFDLAIEPNRPDANCVMGVARDLALWLGARFQELTDPVPFLEGESGRSSVAEGSGCDRLVIAEFPDVRNASFRADRLRRLTLCGQRSISPVVDASNYVMIEIGQPTHPYDMAKLPGGGICVRSARKNEKLVTLDGTKRELTEDDIVIVDLDDRPIGLAGIMGGLDTEIAPDTTAVLLEAAHFDQRRIARTSKRLGLRSEASMRFERGVDPRLAELAVARLAKYCSLEAPAKVAEVENSWRRPAGIKLRESRLAELSGVEDASSMRPERLAALGFMVAREADGWIIEPPTNRPDVTMEEDLIEEVLRHFGYEAVSSKQVVGKGEGLTRSQRRERELRLVLSGMGLNESLPATMVSPEEQRLAGTGSGFIELASPLNPGEATLRVTVLAGLLRALATNAARRMPDLSLFEIGPVFRKGDQAPVEERRLAVLTHDPENGLRAIGPVLATLMETMLAPGTKIVAGSEDGASWPRLHPSRSGRVVSSDGTVIGVAGELMASQLPESVSQLAGLRYGYLELDLKTLLDSGASSTIDPVSPYTSSDLDFSFEVASDIGALDICTAVAKAIGPICTDVYVFDRFRPDQQGPYYLGVRARLESMDGVIDDGLTRWAIEKVEEMAASLSIVLRKG
jgi:phenylalanyl-tRNA synthetase beta chain